MWGHGAAFKCGPWCSIVKISPDEQSDAFSAFDAFHFRLVLVSFSPKPQRYSSAYIAFVDHGQAVPICTNVWLQTINMVDIEPISLCTASNSGVAECFLDLVDVKFCIFLESGSSLPKLRRFSCFVYMRNAFMVFIPSIQVQPYR